METETAIDNISNTLMAKRFISTDLWKEDWFLEMPIEYRFLWIYITCNCDHAGLFKVNLRSFCALNGVTVEQSDAIRFFNNGKDRVRVVSGNVWFIEDFFSFQYGSSLNVNNRVHQSIKELYEKNDIKLTSIRGLKDPKYGVKDIDKDIKSTEEVKEYAPPKDFLKKLIESDLQVLNMGAHITPEEFEECLTQWSLNCEKEGWEYSDDEDKDLKRLRSWFQKWLNTWVSNKRKEKPRQEEFVDDFHARRTAEVLAKREREAKK